MRLQLYESVVPILKIFLSKYAPEELQHVVVIKCLRCQLFYESVQKLNSVSHPLGCRRAGTNLEVGGHNRPVRSAGENFFGCAPPLFCGAPPRERALQTVARQRDGLWRPGQTFVLPPPPPPNRGIKTLETSRGGE